MNVYILHENELEHPIVFDALTHKPEPLILRYAVCKQQYPQLVDSKLTRRCAKKTVVDAVQRICYLINRLAEQAQSDGKIGIHYLAATYKENMEPLIQAMYFQGDWRGESIEQYVKAWRQFYRFLSLQGIDHEMLMPDTKEMVNQGNQEDNFLSHTSYRNDSIGEQETAVDSSWKTRQDDYKENILSMEQFWLLYAEMFKVDAVFAVMAYVQLVTCLRVTALVNCFPLGANTHNPNWLSYKKMRRNKITSQKLKYLAKGGDTKSLLVPVTMMEVFYDVYENPTGSENYYNRLEKYRNKYCPTKHASKSGWNVDQMPTWLLENGTPVSVRTYQKVMQDCAVRIGIEAHPNMLRHTGVTQMLYRYIRNNDLMTGLNHTNRLLVADAHVILQQHLGHTRVETTLRYIRTIERIMQELQIDILLNSSLSVSRKHQDLLDKNPKLANGVAILEKAAIEADSQFDYRIRA